MSRLIDEVVQKLERLQLIHGMSAVNSAIRAYSEALDEDARALFFPESADTSALSLSDTDTVSSTSTRNGPLVHRSPRDGNLAPTHVRLTKHNDQPPRKQTNLASHSSPPPHPPRPPPSLVVAGVPRKVGRRSFIQDTASSSPAQLPSQTSTKFHPLTHSLDASLIKIRFPDRPFEREIHCPPYGQVGSAGRWYVVCVGRQVGVFNEWNDAKASVTGVPHEHQHRVENEESAYYAFKASLEAGKVELVNDG